MDILKKKNTKDISELVIRKKLSILNDLAYRITRLKMEEFLQRFDQWVDRQKDGKKTLIDQNWTCEEVRAYMAQITIKRLPPGRNKTSLAQRNIRDSSGSSNSYRIGGGEPQINEELQELKERVLESEEKSLEISAASMDLGKERLSFEKQQLDFEKEKLAFEKDKKAFKKESSGKK